MLPMTSTGVPLAPLNPALYPPGAMLPRPPAPSPAIATALIPVPMTPNLQQWLRPIGKQCSLEQFLSVVSTEAVFVEALNLFFLFYYNRPVNRASISLLQLFKGVMSRGGYQAV
jgi:hypothetical protein